jgi:uncharacterized protein
MLVDKLSGNFSNKIAKAKNNLSPGAKKIIDESFKSAPKGCIRDFHIHSVGMNKGLDSGAWVNPEMLSWSHPLKHLKFKAYMSAGGIKNQEMADKEYLERLVKLITIDPRYGKVLLFAFDYHHNDQGEIVKERSTFFIPNKYVYSLSQQYPDVFIPAVSIHPYRKDALEELEKYAKLGVRYLKWLPNAQYIDPSSSRIDPFYKIMKKYNMVLISHTGHEKAVEGEEYQKLGNPQLLERPLSLGVKVIMAHMASLGGCYDKTANKMRSCFEVFKDMFQEKKWSKILFADISAVTLYTRLGKPLNYLLNNPQLHKRIVHGSDYPLPAINILYQAKQFFDKGYITNKEKELLQEIYLYNPIIFDFVTKKIIRHPETGKKLLPIAFQTPQGLPCPQTLKMNTTGDKL